MSVTSLHLELFLDRLAYAVSAKANNEAVANLPARRAAFHPPSDIFLGGFVYLFRLSELRTRVSGRLPAQREDQLDFAIGTVQLRGDLLRAATLIGKRVDLRVARVGRVFVLCVVGMRIGSV